MGLEVLGVVLKQRFKKINKGLPPDCQVRWQLIKQLYTDETLLSLRIGGSEARVLVNLIACPSIMEFMQEVDEATLELCRHEALRRADGSR